ncbi:MAG: response regulator transcription factor, partial [Rubrobacteridae bacterium]|nr:response regulator transcription factor [Rubrobacteridae bacterium]
VITKNFALKERLLVDMATLGYRVLISDTEDSDIIVTDYAQFPALSSEDLSKVVLIILEKNHDENRYENNLDNTVLSTGDDILISPYEISELELRINLAMLKRGILETQTNENTLTLDGLLINFDSYEVSIDSEPLDLTFKEYELLKCLITNKGRVYTRDQLLSTVWGYDYYGGARTVDVHVRRLRAKLGRHESLIETVRNVGYRFKK